MKSIVKKEWIRSIFNVAVIAVVMIWQDFLASIPHIEKYTFALVLIYAVYEIRERLKTNRTYLSNDFVRLPHENDNHYKITNVFFGILFICIGIFFYYVQYLGLIGSINFLLIGFILLFLGITHRNSIILVSKNNQEIEVLDTDCLIHSEDKIIEFRRGQITLIQHDNTSKIIKNLDLDFDKVIEIKNWLASKLSNSELKYYRATEGTMEEL